MVNFTAKTGKIYRRLNLEIPQRWLDTQILSKAVLNPDHGTELTREPSP